jgi:polyhydroxyalkanoate synthesis repressor PhaR
MLADTRRKAGPDSAQDGARIIKKYPNRRLYDTVTSSYVTLAEIKQLVIEAHRFVVVDAKTGADLTRSILLQIILEEETAGIPMFSEQALAQLIRFYGHAMQGFMGHYLERNMQAFTELRSRMAEQGVGLSPESWKQFMSMQTPLMQELMNSYVEQSTSVYTTMQEQMRRQAEQFMGAFGIRP